MNGPALLLRQMKDELHGHMRTMALGKNFTIDSDAYTDPHRFEREVEALRERPRALGPLEELEKSASYLIHGEKMFHNVCPHRGARLNRTVDGSVCSYHGWSFDEEGRLRQATGPRCTYPQESRYGVSKKQTVVVTEFTRCPLAPRKLFQFQKVLPGGLYAQGKFHHTGDTK